MRFSDMLCLTALLAATIPAALAEAQIQRPPRAAELIGPQTFECPAELTGWKFGHTFVRPQHDYFAENWAGPLPEGWGFHNSQTYSGWTYLLLEHRVNSNTGEMVCNYGNIVERPGSAPQPYRLVAITRPAPTGSACRPLDDFRFSCRPSVMRPIQPGGGE